MRGIFRGMLNTFKRPESFSIGIITLLAFLLPLIFVPFSTANLSHTKFFVLYILLIVILVSYAISALKRTSFQIPTHWTSFVVITAVVLLGISTWLSPVSHISFWGRYFEPLSFITILMGLFLACIIGFSIKSSENVFTFYTAIGSSFLVWFIVHALNMLSGRWFPDLGFFLGPNATTLENLFDSAIFAGIALLISVPFILLAPGSKFFRTFLSSVLVTSLLTLLVLNISVVWIVIMIFTITVYISVISFGRKHIGTTIVYPTLPLIIFIIGFLALLFGPFITTYVQQPLGISFVSVAPNFSGTLEVTKKTFSDHFLAGVGPNRFEQVWEQYKPEGVNQTSYWNVPFGVGRGYVHTLLATTGLMGALAITLIFVSVLWVIYRLIRSATQTSGIEFIFLITNLSVFVFLLVMISAFSPGITILFFLVTFAGFLIHEAKDRNIIDIKHISVINHPQYGFVYVILSLIVLLGSVYVGYRSVIVYASEIYTISLYKAQSQNAVTPEIIQKFDQGMRFYATDEQFRLRAEINLANAERMAQEVSAGGVINEGVFAESARSMISDANAAIAFDPYHFANTLLLARIYFALEQFGLEEAKGKAMEILDNAESIHPYNPQIPLSKAQLSFTGGDIDAAKEYVQKALEYKPNYSEALLLLADIEAQMGGNDDAIRSLQDAVEQAPFDPALLFNLAFRYYSEKGYKEAANVFVQLLQVQPNNINARYFLALSLYRSGNKENALILIKDLRSLFPNDEQVRKAYDEISGLVSIVSDEESAEDTNASSTDLTN